MMPDSPLRYPGGKAKLAPILAQIIKANGLNGCVYFEPFAGGAGAALRLLRERVVSELYLNDLDPRICSFWYAALNDPNRFADTILSVPLTVEEWWKQKRVCMEADVSNPFELGFATFYLNRCNRSGVILGSGPIGGFRQAGPWKIDARFNRENLATRIIELSNFRDEIHVTQLDALEFLLKRLPRGRKRGDVFVYLDPPYYSRGSRLYMNSYKDEDHRNLARYMRRQRMLKWIASYDDTDFIGRLYASCNISGSLLQYSLQKKRKAKELLIAPSHVRLPDSVTSHTTMAATA